MKRQPRLGRNQVVAQLRELAGRHGGALSRKIVAADQPLVLRSLRLHFSSFASACRAARVAVARPAPRPARRGGASGRASATGRRPGGAGGGEPPARTAPARRWDRAAIVAEIRDRAQAGQPLASSRAPRRLVAAARWHFGGWAAALAAAGVDPAAVRLQRAAYSRPEIIELIRGMAREGNAVRPSTLKAVVKLDAVRALFGSVDAAICEAGIAQEVTHGNQKWSRARVVDELKARAVSGEARLTPALHRAAQLYFGGVHAARKAAGLRPGARVAWTAETLLAELQRRARRGEGDNALWHACTRLFGSVAAARRAAEVPVDGRGEGMAARNGRALLAELRRRRTAGQPLSRGLTRGLRRAFGSLDAARALLGPARWHGVAAPGRRWPAAVVIEKLQAWHAGGGGALSRSLLVACKQRFGSVVRACAAANVAIAATPWTPRRIQRVLGEPGVDVVDPGLVAACIHHFGSVTAARAAVARARHGRWSKPMVIAELTARARRGLRGVGRLLRDPAIRLFGSTAAALRAAAQSGAPPPRGARPPGPVR